jgi:hypothetical protein
MATLMGTAQFNKSTWLVSSFYPRLHIEPEPS